MNTASFSPQLTYLIFSFEHDLAATSKERLFDFSLICVRVNFLFPSLKKNVIRPDIMHHYCLGENMQRMLLHSVFQLHRKATRLSLISNKEVQIFQKPLLGVDE